MTGTSSGQLEQLERRARGLAIAAGRDRPRNAGRGQVRQELARARQGADLGAERSAYASACRRWSSPACWSVTSRPVSRRRAFANRPPLIPTLRWILHTERSIPGAVERDPPREDVLVDAVDERAIEVEEEPLGQIHVAMLRASRSAAPVVP